VTKPANFANDLRDQLIALFQPSDNKLAMKLFGNKNALLKEKLRQKAVGKWVIHPCSNFRFALCRVVLVVLVVVVVVVVVVVAVVVVVVVVVVLLLLLLLLLLFLKVSVSFLLSRTLELV